MRLSLISQTKLALGGDVTITLVADSDSLDLDEVMNQVWRQIYLFERRFSRFLPDSELSVFNRAAGTEVKVSSELRAILTEAKAQSEHTGGLFNPFILPVLQQSGYVGSAVPGYEADFVDDFRGRRVVGADSIVINAGAVSIPQGTAIDLGGCGKGYLADEVGRWLRDQGVSGYQISFGGDIATFGHDAAGDNWRVHIQDASNLEASLPHIIVCPIEPFAVATSGTFRRGGQRGADRDWHHIIDPVTLQPAQTDIRLATVCATRAIDADVLASCAVILGAESSRESLRRLGAMAIIIQSQNESGKISCYREDFDESNLIQNENERQHA